MPRPQNRILIPLRGSFCMGVSPGNFNRCPTFKGKALGTRLAYHQGLQSHYKLIYYADIIRVLIYSITLYLIGSRQKLSTLHET